MNLRHSIKYLLKTLKIILSVGGVIFFVGIFLSFTNYPFWAYYNLGKKNSAITDEPHYIIQMGGSGMPSPDALIRCYYTANLAEKYHKAKIIVAIPSDSLNLLHVNKIKRELLLRKIDSTRIQFEPLGINTFTQAKNISGQVITQQDTSNIIVVTSPEHIYRAVKTFEKLGFNQVYSQASFEKSINHSLLNKKEYKDLTSQNLNLRYNFWNYLKLEITVAREYCAIIYYKLKGWI